MSCLGEMDVYCPFSRLIHEPLQKGWQGIAEHTQGSKEGHRMAEKQKRKKKQQLPVPASLRCITVLTVEKTGSLKWWFQSYSAQSHEKKGTVQRTKQQVCATPPSPAVTSDECLM